MQTESAVPEQGTTRLRTKWTKVELALAQRLVAEYDPSMGPLEVWVATLLDQFPGRRSEALVRKFTELKKGAREGGRRRRGKDARGRTLTLPNLDATRIQPDLLSSTVELLSARTAIIKVRDEMARLEGELQRLRAEEQRLVAEYQPRLSALLEEKLSV